MRTIRLTESELTKLVKTVIKESENETFVAEMNADLSEVGLPKVSLDDLNSNSIPMTFIDQTLISDPKKNEGNEKKKSTLDAIQTAICSADEGQLETAKEEIKNIIKKKKSGIGNAIKNIFNKKNNEKPVNEQVELTAAATILGITAPLWVWFAIGAIVLFLILKTIFRRRDGYGCRGTFSWDQLIRKNNRFN
jgi:hypothetical protein